MTLKSSVARVKRAMESLRRNKWISKGEYEAAQDMFSDIEDFVVLARQAAFQMSATFADPNRLRNSEKAMSDFSNAMGKLRRKIEDYGEDIFSDVD